MWSTTAMLLALIGFTMVSASYFEWETERVLLTNILDTPRFYIASNSTQYEIEFELSRFTCPPNYACQLQIGFDSMACETNEMAPTPNYLKLTFHGESEGEGKEVVRRMCSTFQQRTIALEDKNSTKVTIQPIGEDWAANGVGFNAAFFVFVRVVSGNAKKLVIDETLPNVELNFRDNSQYVITLENFQQDLFPVPSWTQYVRLYVAEMSCASNFRLLLQVESPPPYQAFSSRIIACDKEQDVNYSAMYKAEPGVVILLGGIEPDLLGKELTLTAATTTSAIVTFTTQMFSESYSCPNEYFNCYQESCDIKDIDGRHLCIPIQLTCDKKLNCMNSCAADEAESLCNWNYNSSRTDSASYRQLRQDFNDTKYLISYLGLFCAVSFMILLGIILLVFNKLGLMDRKFGILAVTLEKQFGRRYSLLPSYEDVNGNVNKIVQA